VSVRCVSLSLSLSLYLSLSVHSVVPVELIEPASSTLSKGWNGEKVQHTTVGRQCWLGGIQGGRKMEENFNKVVSLVFEWQGRGQLINFAD
jgi:hypothetical protein